MAGLCDRLRPFSPNNPSPLSPSLFAPPGLEVSSGLLVKGLLDAALRQVGGRLAGWQAAHHLHGVLDPTLPERRFLRRSHNILRNAFRTRRSQRLAPETRTMTKMSKDGDDEDKGEEGVGVFLPAASVGSALLVSLLGWVAQVLKMLINRLL